jgi:hypothetical protein
MTENGLTEPKSSQRLLAPLYGLLAASIVRLVVDAWEHPQPLRTVAAGLPEPIRAKAGDGLYWQLLSVFERACETLYLIGVGVPANADFTPVGPHILKVDGENVAAFVERRVTLAEYECRHSTKCSRLSSVALVTLDTSTLDAPNLQSTMM